MKKLIALLFVVAMLSAFVVMPAMAANDAPAIAISNKAAHAGETATLEVSIVNNPGVFNYKMELVYDETKLELVGMEAVNADNVNPANGQANYYSKDLKGDVVLFTATFKVLVEGDHNVSVNVITIRNTNQEVFEIDVNDGGIDDTCEHVWGKYVVTRKATCAKAGLKVKTCTLCGEQKTATIAKLAHTVETRNAKAATCTEAGYTGDEYCSVCNKLLTAGTEIPATGHKNTEVKNAKAATCTEAGYTGDTYCADCGEKLEDGKTIEATGHKWGTHKHDENGHWQECTVCGTKGQVAAHEGNPCSVCGYEAESGVPVVVIVIAAVAVVGGAGAAGYFFVFKKKKA